MKRIFLSLLIFILPVGTVMADCDLADFDLSSPPSVRDQVPEGATYFEWASDADPSPDGDGERAWHYIRNLHDDDLSLIWEKPDALIPLDQPLGKNQVSCFYKYGAAFIIDPDAPITTSREGQKNAKAYVPDGDSQKTGAEVGREGDGFTGRIRAIIRYFQDDKVLTMQLSSSNDELQFLLGVSGLGIAEEVLVGEFSDTIGSTPVLQASFDVFAKSGDFGVQFVEPVADSQVMTFQFAGEAEIVFNDVTEVAPVMLPLALLNADGQVLAATKIDLAPLIEN